MDENNYESPMIDAWLEVMSTDEGLETVVPEVNPDGPLPTYLFFEVSGMLRILKDKDRSSSISSSHAQHRCCLGNRGARRRVGPRQHTALGPSNATGNQGQGDYNHDGGDLHNEGDQGGNDLGNMEQVPPLNPMLGSEEEEEPSQEVHRVEQIGDANNEVNDPHNVNPAEHGEGPEEEQSIDNINDEDIDPQLDASAGLDNNDVVLPLNEHSENEEDEQLSHNVIPAASQIFAEPEYLGWHLHGIRYPSNFTREHAIICAATEFVTQQYLCMLLNAEAFQLPDHLEILHVGIVFRNDGDHAAADNEQWGRRYSRRDVVLNEVTTLFIDNYYHSHWRKTTYRMRKDGSGPMIIHYQIVSKRVHRYDAFVKLNDELTALKNRIKAINSLVKKWDRTIADHLKNVN